MDAQPECVTGPMREYQMEGLRWLVQRVGDAGVNAILADEMVRPPTPGHSTGTARMVARRTHNPARAYGGTVATEKSCMQS